MPTRDSAPNGAPCWIDLTTSDTDKSRDFYTQLFGWTAEEPDPQFGGYFNFVRQGVRVAGGLPAQMSSGPTDVWSVYLCTDDAEKVVAVTPDQGGQVMVPAMPVAELGTMAVLLDSDGAAIGVWQPGLHRGFTVYNEVGAPSWFELLTRDYEGSLDFYRNVFGWDTQTMSDTDDFRYTVLVRGEDWLAGVMDASGFLPEGAPSCWSVYFGVADTDAALARVVELGGAVVRPAEDTPYGRLATASDSTGAQFKLVASPAIA